MRNLFPVILGFLAWMGQYNIIIPIFPLEVFFLVFFFYQVFITKKMYFDKTVVNLILMWIVQLITVILNDSHALQGAKLYLFAYMIYSSLMIYLSNNYFTKDDIDIFFKRFIMSFALFSIIQIMFIIQKNQMWIPNSIFMYKSQFKLFYGSSNYIAALFVGINTWLFKDMLEKKSKNNFIFVFILYISVLYLNSRTSLLIMTSMFLCVSFYELFFKKANLKQTFRLVFAVFIIILIIINLPITKLMIMRFNTETNNFYSRKIIFNNMMIKYKSSCFSKLLFGYGIGYDKLRFEILAHNILPRILLSNGVIGLLIYVKYISQGILFKSNFASKYNLLIYSWLAVSLMEPVLYTAFIEYFVAITFACLASKKNVTLNKNKVNNDFIIEST